MKNSVSHIFYTIWSDLHHEYVDKVALNSVGNSSFKKQLIIRRAILPYFPKKDIKQIKRQSNKHEIN